MSQDEEHLKLLSIFHYVHGGILAVFALFPIFHLVFGLVMILAPEQIESENGSGPEMAFMGWFVVLFAVAFISVGWVMAGCIIAAGRSLAKRKRYLFCMIIAGIQCLFMPLGTVLGVFTIIVLMRESVKEMFNKLAAAPEGNNA